MPLLAKPLSRRQYRLLPLIALLLGACATTPPDGDFTNQATALQHEFGNWALEQNTFANASNLNQLVSSADLNNLITIALQANPDLQQTLITLQIAQTEQRQVRGQALPQIGAGLQGVRSESGSDGSISNRYTGSLTISWEADIWAKLADKNRAAAKTVMEKALLLQGARDTLVAQLCKQWLDLVAAQQQIALQSQLVENLQLNQDFVDSRYRSGLSSRADLDNIQTSLASTEATLESSRESLKQAQRALSTLLGGYRPEPSQLPQKYPNILPPLLALPPQTLARRPDLQAAFAAIEASAFQRKAAYKDMLPQFSLSAALEDVANTPSRALLTNPLWSLLGQLTAPLYQGGQLKAAADIAALQEAQRYQAYRATLLTAVNEVEDTLSIEQSLQRQQQLIGNAVANAARNLGNYQQKYRAGLIDMLDLLTVQQQTFDLLLKQNELQRQRLTNRIDLALALGLGWEAPAPAQTTVLETDL
ncbi:MAG: TolC family protein [Zhongshania sp.]|uniref:TolC family protein n=1 Tax=Zhongshania sp. TaxID=1971902 RepID=UPI0026205ACD|nr:TolC family protein [Zhongshania sp.]MDF1693519.1 TolC family protein [Zhongshania sp.]